MVKPELMLPEARNRLALSEGQKEILIPVLLFFGTIATVSVSGYFAAKAFVVALEVVGKPHSSILELTLLYTIALMSVLGLHELGHLVACRYHGIKATWPLFIPGIPGITPGTFGAIIKQKSPTVNRDQLFDLGLSGLVVGFVASLIISYFGYLWSVPINEVEFRRIVSALGVKPGGVIPPLLFLFLAPYIFPAPPAFTYWLHPLGQAGWIGTLITFLNLFPIAQLDAGHISRALLGPRWHKVLSYISIAVMVLTGWWPMAILALFLMGVQHPGPLDDVSDLTISRKIVAIVPVIMFTMCFTFSRFSIVVGR